MSSQEARKSQSIAPVGIPEPPKDRRGTWAKLDEAWEEQYLFYILVFYLLVFYIFVPMRPASHDPSALAIDHELP